jgi:hypothetical protein
MKNNLQQNWKKYLAKGVIFSFYTSVIGLSITTGAHYIKSKSTDKKFEEEKLGEYISNFTIKTYAKINKKESTLPTVVFISGIGTSSEQFSKVLFHSVNTKSYMIHFLNTRMLFLVFFL